MEVARSLSRSRVAVPTQVLSRDSMNCQAAMLPKQVAGKIETPCCVGFRHQAVMKGFRASTQSNTVRRPTRSTPPAVAAAAAEMLEEPEMFEDYDETAASEEPEQRLRIKLKAFFSDVLEESCDMILDAAYRTGADKAGPVRLPTKLRRWCVLRSPHVNKDSREHFELRTHSRLIDLWNPSAQTIDELLALDLPAGVDVEIKL